MRKLAGKQQPARESAAAAPQVAVRSNPGKAAGGSAQLELQRTIGNRALGRLLAPQSVAQALGTPGTPLEEGLRLDMGRRFDRDFSKVRIHAGPAAARSASDIGAEAYTAGHDIVVGGGGFAPHTQAGRRLLIHELTHVAQQASGAAGGRIQAKPAGKILPKTQTSVFTLRPITKTMTPDELTRAFVIQRYGPMSEAEVDRRVSQWTNTSHRGATEADVARGYMILRLTTADQAEFETQFDTLDPEEQKAVNAETDKRFWETTGYKPGQKLGTSPKDREMARVWAGMRNAVLNDRRLIEQLPDDIKQVLFAGGEDARVATPEDYAQILRIAQKLARLPPAARQDYLARINAATTSLDAVEQSVDSYVGFQQQREAELVEGEKAAKPLFGLDEVYPHYRYYKLYLKDVDPSSVEGKEDQDLVKRLKLEQENALLQELKPKGFDSIAAFEEAIEAYRIAFRTRAVNLALDVLARYEHALFEERNKLQRPGAAAEIARGIAGSRASELYKTEHEQAGAARTLEMGHEPKETWWIEPHRRAREASETAHAEAEAEVIRGSGKDFLVSGQGTDREKFVGLDAVATEKYLFELMEKRSEEVRSARRDFAEDPDRVFKLESLIAASYQIQGIEADTIYGRIISDYIKDEKAKHLLSDIVIGILAIALAFLVPVGGWIAAAALVANAAISTYQAYTAYKGYKEEVRDYDLGFLSEEPSLFWVGLAIAAAALDLKMATSQVLKESAGALKALKGPMLEFSSDGDLAKLVAKIEAADANRILANHLKTEAKASLEAAKEAYSDVLGIAGGRLGGFVGLVVDPGVAKGVYRGLAALVKRGVTTLAQLRAEAKFVSLVSEITRLTGAERAELEVAFEEVKELVKRGQAKSMDDASLLGFIDRWALNRTKPGFQAKLFEEMKAWKPLTAEQQSALNALNQQKAAVATLYEHKAQAERELFELRAKPVQERTGEDVAEIRSLEKELSELDPVAYPPRVPPAARRPGKIAIAEEQLEQSARQAERAQLTLYDRLRAAAPSEAAKERALKGVVEDQVGTLKKPPSGILHVDHIVSVREIADMDGFADLLWKDQKAIVDMKENLIAMDSAANASKGDRTWRSWRQASGFYDDKTIEKMIAQEAEVRQKIQDAIKDRLAQRGAP